MNPTGYLARVDGALVITDWRGGTLGPARIVTSWATPHSHVSTRMYQVEATLDGVTYTGRTAGMSMAWRGRPKKGTD